MFVINEDKSIYLTRGDVAFFSVQAKTESGEAYKFQPGDVVRFKVFEKKNCKNVALSKDFGIEAETEEVEIFLEEKDTKIGEIISKPVTYWYEVELNPYTEPQTIVGYDEDGAKIFMLYPEGNEAEDDEPITPEDIPVVDEELDLTSTRPVQNQAIARAILKIEEEGMAQIAAIREDVYDGLADARGRRVINVAEPEENTDAVTKAYADGKYLPLDGSVPMTSYLVNKTNSFPVVQKERVINGVTYQATLGIGQTSADADGVGSASIELRSSADNFASIVGRLDLRADGKIRLQAGNNSVYLYGLQDISNDFIESLGTGVVVAEKKIYKQGNIINGYMYLDCENATSNDLFTVKGKYASILPNVLATFKCTSAPEDRPNAIYSFGNIWSIEGADVTKIYKLMLNFTYVCEN